ncbi:YlbF family regulator [Haploplasma axanthum]|uniref:Protein of uncharacterized function (DUF964) n=1 Tax=Haploplasma axanthum TaxID=29552 RepID=A0A449BE00_HAPAX|nr:YlbF family regulator [Haploplasma axanthum]VEU80684.1 Protein of uncharacterised function (DUF964) [Haploplasma axanthum]
MKIENKIIEKIKNEPKIKRYKELEDILNQNQEVSHKIEELKNIQKQMINAKNLGKIEIQTKLENDYQNKLEEIENYPLMTEYMDLQEEINVFLQNIKEIIESGIDSDLNAK